ncbi:hypothetical protein [Streptomyces sp. AVP053U2]|uniref:hypothetical protein n=1 Tax=Streptomyces sp. AVP053U2 TaxID=1737066 RepID=UPI00073AFDA2|nr:hypothetical protein [Streptomyces sp. AVP053U2]ODA69257.1 hypothetical protein APS67_006603 [Streptomyces sp. AVP053U2]
MSIRTFTRAQLEALGLPDETVTADRAAEYPELTVELHREYIESRRWESVHELVFRAPDDGKAYRVTYRESLTEMQDSDPWNYEDTVKAVEVEQRPVTVMQWQPADEQTQAADVQLVDRAAVLREGAAAIEAAFTGPGLDRYTRYGADLLRRMAAKEQS